MWKCNLSNFFIHSSVRVTFRKKKENFDGNHLNSTTKHQHDFSWWLGRSVPARGTRKAFLYHNGKKNHLTNLNRWSVRLRYYIIEGKSVFLHFKADKLSVIMIYHGYVRLKFRVLTIKLTCTDAYFFRFTILILCYDQVKTQKLKVFKWSYCVALSL